MSILKRIHQSKKLHGRDVERRKMISSAFNCSALYKDIYKKIMSKNDVQASMEISLHPFFRCEEGLSFLASKKSEILTLKKYPEISIAFQKRILKNDMKAKLEYHYYNDNLFFVNITFSYLKPVEKKALMEEMVMEFGVKNSQNFESDKSNLIDRRGNILSFENTYNYSTNDFSVNYLFGMDKVVEKL